MRKAQGYICLVKTSEQTAAFGKDTGHGTGFAEALATNGITPFDSREDAARARRKFKQVLRGQVRRIRIVWVEVSIAESEKEWGSLPRANQRRSRRYIVIGEADGNLVFLGAPSREEGKTAYPLPGSYLWQNGWEGFTRFSAAEWTAREIHRQGQIKTRLASIALHVSRPES